jgi:DNA-binding SARP family transcriptional activator/tetratricopeptide (TPR) repeat protein
MWLRVLGPVQVRDGSTWLGPRGPQLRLLLACLALSAGQVVLVDDLIDALWEERPPPSARASLQILVVRLRKAMTGLPGCALDRYGEGYQLRTIPDTVDVHRFRSLVRSAWEARDARDENGAIGAFDQALALWRGPALADVPTTVAVEAIRAGLAEEQLSAVQDRFGCLLAAGRDGQAAAEIPPVLARHPLAERLAGMLMIAWYRCGRQADALRVFRDLRGRLAGELAVEPGPELQRLHQRILAADPALAASDDLAGPLMRGGGAARADGRNAARADGRNAARADGRNAAPTDGRNAAPADGRNGTPADGRNGASADGRDAGIWRLRPLQPADTPGRPENGKGGKAAGTPGNGQRGIEAGRNQPLLDCEQSLEPPPRDGHARARMGTTAAAMVPRQLPAAPAHFTGRRRELRSLTGWLDAGTAAGQAVILAIGGTAGVGKTALALHWAHQVQHRFPDGQLYVNLRGFDASSAPVAPAEAITELLEALEVPAGRLSPRLDARAGLYRSLVAGKRMLVVLDNARDEAQVRPLLPGASTCVVLVTGRSQLAGLVAVEGARPLTLDVLSETEARQLLASHLGADRVAGEAAEVAELTALCARLPLALAITAARAALRPVFPLASLTAGLRDTRERLDWLGTGDQAADVRVVFSWSYRLLGAAAARMFRLLGAHPGPDISETAAASLAAISRPAARAALSELIRANLLQEQAPGRFSLHDLLRAYAADLGDEKERRSAVGRVLDHYLHTAREAMSLVYPHADLIGAPPPGPGEPAESFSGPQQARAWLQAEYRALLAAAAAAADSGHDTHGWQLPAVLREHFDRRGYYADWAQCQQLALLAADRLGDHAAQAIVHQFLGEALIHLCRWDDAHSHLHDALKLYRRLGDYAGQALCHFHIGWIFECREAHRQALSHHRLSLSLFRAAGYLAGEAFALNGVGWDNALLGNYQQALSYCSKALELHHKSGNRLGEALTLDSLGYCCHQADRYNEAVAYYQQALRAYADADDRYFRAITLIHLGETHQANGHREATLDLWQQALTILDDLQHPDAAPTRAKLHGLTAPAPCL